MSLLIVYPRFGWKVNLIFAIFNRLGLIIGSSVILSIWQSFVMQEIISQKKHRERNKRNNSELSKNDSYAISKMESINCVARFIFWGWIFQLVQDKKKAHAQEKIGYSWKEREEKIACHCGRALEKAMNNKILKSTDENINMNFFMCLLRHTTFLIVCLVVVCRMSKEEKFMNQFYGTNVWNISMMSSSVSVMLETMRVYFI